MRLYLANSTAQDFIANVRIPEVNGIVTQKVPAGGQIMFGNDGMNQPQVDEAIRQLRRYGLVGSNEISRHPQKKVTLLFSIGKPVDRRVLIDTINGNKGVMRQEGDERRKAAAIAIDKRATEMAQMDGLPTHSMMETSVQEEKSGTLVSEDKPLNEGVRVVADGDDRVDPQAPAQRRSRRKAA